MLYNTEMQKAATLAHNVSLLQGALFNWCPPDKSVDESMMTGLLGPRAIMDPSGDFVLGRSGCKIYT